MDTQVGLNTPSGLISQNAQLNTMDILKRIEEADSPETLLDYLTALGIRPQDIIRSSDFAPDFSGFNQRRLQEIEERGEERRLAKLKRSEERDQRAEEKRLAKVLASVGRKEARERKSAPKRSDRAYWMLKPIDNEDVILYGEMPESDLREVIRTSARQKVAYIRDCLKVGLQELLSTFDDPPELFGYHASGRHSED